MPRHGSVRFLQNSGRCQKPCVPICSFCDLLHLSGLGEGQLPAACVSLVKEKALEPDRRYEGTPQSTEVVPGVQGSHGCSPHVPAPRILPTRVFLQLDPHLLGFFFLASDSILLPSVAQILPSVRCWIACPLTVWVFLSLSSRPPLLETLAFIVCLGKRLGAQGRAVTGNATTR